jgi:hypothetical protein
LNTLRIEVVRIGVVGGGGITGVHLQNVEGVEVLQM